MSVAQKNYIESIVPKMKEKYRYSNSMQVPKIVKIVINRGVGDNITDSKAMEQTVEEFRNISGQKPIVIKSREAISNFKLKQNYPIGCKVTLRNKRMYDFMSRLVNLALPRIKDFRGVSKRAFDGKGNYNLGLKEHLIFPEIDFDSIVKVRGLDIAIITSAKTDDEAYWLLKWMGMPFREK